MKDWLAAHTPESVAALLAALTAWFTQRGVRIRSLAKRIAKLERNQVTRDDFSQLTESVVSQIANNQLRTEERFLDVQATQRLILDKLIPGAGER